MTPGEVCREVLSDWIFFNESSGGVTFSGGEPLLQIPFLKKTLMILKESGIHTAVDTCGYSTEEELREIIDLTDLFLYDLKIMDEEEHKRYCGVSNRRILSNLQFLYEQNKKVIIRFPVIPGINDSGENIDSMISCMLKMSDRFRDIDLLPYHSLAREKYFRFGSTNKLSGLPDLKKENLLPVKQAFESAGFNVQIGG